MKKLLVAVTISLANIGSSPAQVNPRTVTQVTVTGNLPIGLPRTSQGANTFNANFSVNATGRNDLNAYLLSYLATAVYTDRIIEFETPTKSPSQIDNEANTLNQNSGLFMEKFRKITSPFFSSVTSYNGADMELFEPTSGQFDGYDPEAIIIPTSTAIYVTFRGTDRVAQNNNIGSVVYKAGEWLLTDFQPITFNPAAVNNTQSPFKGRVHQGMWISITKIAERMCARIAALGGRNKKVWITGHSLGAGQAQLFSYYLAKVHNIIPQGVYVYAPPQVGDVTFNNDFITVLGNREKLQRFDFIDDPVTVFAMAVPNINLKPTGTRVFYPSLDAMVYDAPERPAGVISRIALSAPGVIADLGGAGMGGMCFHHAHWYMQAAHRQLTATEKTKVPVPLPVPTTAFMGCSSGFDINRAVNPSQVTEGLLDITDGMIEIVTAAISSNVNKLASALKNFAGSALKNGEGVYKIKCGKGGRYLNVNGSCYTNNSCNVMLWGLTASGNNEKFDIKKYGLGYGVEVIVPNTDKMLDVKDMSTANNAAIQTYDKHFVPIVPNNQIWYFHQIGTTNKYIIQNERSGKVLEADNANTGNAGCGVRQNPYRKGATNQIWILEKVN